MCEIKGQLSDLPRSSRTCFIALILGHLEICFSHLELHLGHVGPHLGHVALHLGHLVPRLDYLGPRLGNFEFYLCYLGHPLGQFKEGSGVGGTGREASKYTMYNIQIRV